MFSGSLVAIVTPLRPDGAVDFPAWERLLDWHREQGSAGIVIGGTTGESATLEDGELRELCTRARARLGDSLPLIAGAGTSSTARTVERVSWLSGLPIDGLLVVTPAYNRPTQEGLYQHFAAVARAAQRPVVLYNVPGRTAVDMQPATVARLAKLPGVVGVKEAVADVGRVRQLLEQCPDDFDVLSGDDATAREASLAGARGVISVTANVAPGAMAAMVAAALAGDAAAAGALDAPLAALHRELFVESNPIPVKWALERMGRIGSGIRLPLTRLAEACQPGVLAALRSAGALN